MALPRSYDFRFAARNKKLSPAAGAETLKEHGEGFLAGAAAGASAGASVSIGTPSAAASMGATSSVSVSVGSAAASIGAIGAG